MFAGPIFQREVLVSPRHWRHFVLRAGYVGALIILIYTAAQVTFGFQSPRTIGGMARFGHFVFQVMCVVQLALVLAASMLFCAGRVSQEKDRRTLVLLLMTDLRSSELVLGKLLSGLLPVAVLIGISVPCFFAVKMLGGVSLGQVLWFELLCVAMALAAGGWGALVGFWRDKTFQTLAVTVLGGVLFLGLIEGLTVWGGERSSMSTAARVVNPLYALRVILDPLTYSGEGALGAVVLPTVLGLTGMGVALIVVSSLRVRIWNPTRSVHAHAIAEQQAEAFRKTARHVWQWPIVWREMQTRAYGRKTILIKLAYLVFAGAFLWTMRGGEDAELVLGVIRPEGFAFVVVSLVSLLLINAQTVTALTSERDGQTLELLLVTEVTAPEFVFGKLAGALYNAKELIAVPILSIYWLRWSGFVNGEGAVFLILGFVTLVLFAAMLGLHSGLGYDISRQAIINSLGTMFFLFIGVFVLMVLILEARASFALQFVPFLAFICGGSFGLWFSLTPKNPSPAFMIAAVVLPFLTFYAASSFMLGHTMATLLAVLVAYGFPAVAMLMPAISNNDFDAMLGRATLDQQ